MEYGRLLGYSLQTPLLSANLYRWQKIHIYLFCNSPQIIHFYITSVQGLHVKPTACGLYTSTVKDSKFFMATFYLLIENHLNTELTWL